MNVCQCAEYDTRCLSSQENQVNINRRRHFYATEASARLLTLAENGRPWELYVLANNSAYGTHAGE